jgi:hypothetical protein
MYDVIYVTTCGLLQAKEKKIQNLSKFTPFASLYSDPAYGRVKHRSSTECTFYIKCMWKNKVTENESVEYS